MIDYFPNGYDEAKRYSPLSNKRVQFKCPYCGKIKENKISIYNLYKR